MTGRTLVKRRGGDGGVGGGAPQSANFSSPQSSTVAKSKIVAYYKNVQLCAQNMFALKAISVLHSVQSIYIAYQ